MEIYDAALANLTSLPRPSRDLPDGITDDALLSFEAAYGIAIPDDVRLWLKRTNGAFVDSQVFLGILSGSYIDMAGVYALHPQWLALSWLPVAADGCGNYYVVALNGQYGPGYPVLFVDHEESLHKPAYLVASSFRVFVPLFIENERKRSPWPFDRSLTLRLDPDLVHCFGAALPWDT